MTSLCEKIFANKILDFEKIVKLSRKLKFFWPLSAGVIHKPCGQFFGLFDPLSLCGPFYENQLQNSLQHPNLYVFIPKSGTVGPFWVEQINASSERAVVQSIPDLMLYIANQGLLQPAPGMHRFFQLKMADSSWFWYEYRFVCGKLFRHWHPPAMSTYEWPLRQFLQDLTVALNLCFMFATFWNA